MDWPYPTVRHLITCRRPNPIDAAYREAILRVVFALRPPAGTMYPFRLPELHVFAQVTGGVGTFEFAVELFRMDTDPVLIAAAPPITGRAVRRSPIRTTPRGGSTSTAAARTRCGPNRT